ncbi:hypothetical protein O6H91_19G029600 [Diphasiastrum complanatum]|uniref:Uncharacterized protein n=1 Tax=Diphasiastrum complanatum TaxID=34168 RepID=A0ACC2ATQ5_DIPCM|nr:hypothetical protein O6H91_19G029600 [Diphasiastrum complanatum]
MASIDEVRNSYNFVQAGLSTLAAGASVALCLARGRLDSEMNLADLFCTTRFNKQNNNDYGALVSFHGNNGCILGINVRGSNANTVMWVAHNTWVQGSYTTLVPFWTSYVPNATQDATQNQDSTASTPRCTCWHIPSISVHGSGRTSVNEMPREMFFQPTSQDPQCYRVPSYQCEQHGRQHMPDLHSEIMQTYRGVPAPQLHSAVLKGPSKLYQLMLDDERSGTQSTYLFAVDRLGAASLARMVSESMATLDSSQKGRTSDLVDWSLGKLDLSDKPDIKWIGNAATVVLVGVAELVLLLLLSCVFGLDPFVSSLGARRGVRSLRLGANGITQFADLWLEMVGGDNISGWNTPILRVVPRKNLRLWYLDWAFKVCGLVIAFVFWALTVFGYVHPLGLHRNDAWGILGNWAAFVALIGNVIGIFTSGLPLRLDQSLPGRRHDPGYSMVGYSLLQCFSELALTILRTVPHFRHMKWLRRCWYVMLETGIWVQWFAAKRCLLSGPQSESSGVTWEQTLIQAGALARATVLSAVSGKWSSG